MPSRTGYPGCYLDPVCPIEWAHPLTRGLVGWWQVGPNPGWRGGATLRDLVRGGRSAHDGTLTNGATWAAPGTRPGGHGCLSLDGTNDYVDCGTLPDRFSAGVTISAWLYMTGAISTIYRNVLSARKASDNTTPFSLDIDGKDHTASPRFYVNSGGFKIWSANSYTLPTSTWTHLSVAYASGATPRIYVNGIAQVVTQTSGATTPAILYTANNLLIGWFTGASAADSSWSGLMDGVCLHGTALSAAGVYALYDQSRRGNPETWRWLSTRTWFVLSDAGAGGSVGASDGTSTVTGTGASLAASTGASAGTGTATAVGASLAATVGSAAGVGTATAGGAGLAAAIGASAGVGAATAAGASLAASDGAAAGTCTALGVGASLAEAIGASSGTCTATAAGANLAAADGAAAGTGTVSGQGASLAAADGAIGGTSTAAAVGASLAAAVGSAAGTATVVGHASGASDGTAEGTSTVLGVGASLVAADGTSTGTSSATGTGAALQAAAGSASGSASVAGAGAALASAAGDSTGTGAVFGAGAALWAALGAAAGTSTVLGVSPSTTTGGYYFRRYILSRRG